MHIQNSKKNYVMKQKSVPPNMQFFLDGQVLLLDKPQGWTSFDIVKKVRILTSVSKVGHAGTLDPLATGLLIVCTGKFTKKINEYMKMEKEYTGSFKLGAITKSYDLESEPTNFVSISHINEQAIYASTKAFTGDILQIPPMHSAIKKDGKPLYILARKGEEIELAPRPITISKFEIINIDLPYVHFKVVCSSGTYIRSLAHDFGKALGTGAYLSSLCRTRIGSFLLKNAKTIKDFENDIIKLRQLQNGNPMPN